MATYTPSSPVDHVGRGHKPPAPPATGGGDDGRGGGDIPNYGARLRRARLGLACGIATVCMVFISLTSAYIVRQGLPTFDGTSNSYVRDWGRVDLPWLLLAINTAVLLISSVTMEFARRESGAAGSAGSGEVDPWNLVGEREIISLARHHGAVGDWFLAGQWLAWGELHARGFFVDTNPNSSFVFLLTIAHAIHLGGGMIALIWAASASLLHKPVESRRIVVDITAWYWHFMAVLWIYVFALLGFAR